MNNELRNVISGIREITERNLIQTALFFIRESESISRKIEKSKLFDKEGEIELLKIFAKQNCLWHQTPNENNFIGEGAEQRVFLNSNGKSVVKINDTIFYATVRTI